MWHVRTTPRTIQYFFARDIDSVNWIIEGKYDLGRGDDMVRSKRGAAERALRILDSDPNWREIRWGYLIGDEGDIEIAAAWTNLKQMSGPKRMVGLGR